MQESTISPDSPPPKEKSVKKARSYGPVAAIIVTIFAYVFSQFFSISVLSLGFELFGRDAVAALQDLGNSAVLQAVYILIVGFCTIYVIWLFMRTRGVSWKDIGLGRRPVWRDSLLALGIMGLYLVTIGIVNAIISGFIPAIDTQQSQQIGFENIDLPYQLVLVFVSLVVIPPIVEEILIRGFLYTGLRVRFTKITAALIASILFGLAHLQLGSGAPPLWIAAIDTAILSLFLIYLREKTGALWAGMIVHAVKNGLAFFLLFVVKWG